MSQVNIYRSSETYEVLTCGIPSSHEITILMNVTDKTQKEYYIYLR